MATMNVLNSVGGTESVEKPLAPGRAAAASSRPVTLSTEDFAVIDGIETAIAATNTAIASTNTAIGTTNTTLSTIDGRVDGLETLVAATNTAIATTNSSLTTIDGRVDTLETLIASTNTKLDTAITALQLIDDTVTVEDAAAAANPSGHPLVAVRRDTLTVSEVSADGDYVAAKATSKGQLHVYAQMDTTQLSPLGQAVMASSAPVVIASNQTAVPISNTPLTNFGAGEYETVAAGVTSPQTLGATGAVGDYLAGVLVIPSSTSPSAVTIKDGGGTAITVFAGGASSVSNLVPFFIPLGLISVAGAWQLTTGASGASAIGIGNFT